MNQKFFVSVSEETLSVEKAIEFVKADNHGAVDLFIGTVRNRNLGLDVVAVDYDVFIPLALTVFESICQLAINQFHPSLKIYLSHFKGKLPVGGLSVIIAVSSPHRDESFSACRYILEEIKVKAPIWKQEHYIDGLSEWVKGHALCQHH
jgi:molybdopterin synthase catalytic subunit